MGTRAEQIDSHLVRSCGGTAVTLGDRLAAEGQLLQSIPECASKALQQRWERVQHDPQRAMGDLASTAAFCCVAGLITRNPALFGEGLAPVIGLVGRHAGTALLGASMVDLTRRTAAPMARTWNTPNEIAYTKYELGTNIGDALFDYSTNAIAGGLGFAAGGRLNSFLGDARLFDARNQLCFAVPASYGVADSMYGTVTADDFIVKSQRFNPRDLPPSIRLTGKVAESKSSQGAEPGDVALDHFETRNHEAVRFGIQMKVDDYRWVRLDLYDPKLHHAFHGLNVFQLNEKRPFLLNLIAQQAGREARIFTTDRGTRTYYELADGVAIPRGYQPPLLPSSLRFEGNVYAGALRPKHDAQSIPDKGAIWLKFEEQECWPTSTRMKPTRIVPLVSTGQAYAQLGTQHFDRLNFDAVRQAQESARHIREMLGDRIGDLLVLRRSSPPLYTFPDSRR